MALRFSRDEATGIYRVEADAGFVLSLEAILAVDRELLEVIGDPAASRVLYDVRGVDTSQMSTADFEQLALATNRLWSGAAGARGAVLTNATLAFGQARQYELLSEEGRARGFGVFTDPDAATAWLLGDGPANAAHP